MNRLSFISTCCLALLSANAYAQVTITEQSNDVTYDSTNVFKPNGEILLRDTGVSFTSDQEFALITLDGKTLSEEISLTNGSNSIQLNVWDMAGDHQSTYINYNGEDIDYPIEIIKQIEEPVLNQNENMTAINFASSFMDIDAKDGIIYATVDKNQYLDTGSLGQHTTTLWVIDINGDQAETEVAYTVK